MVQAILFLCLVQASHPTIISEKLGKLPGYTENNTQRTEVISSSLVICTEKISGKILGGTERISRVHCFLRLDIMVPCSSLMGKEAWEEWGNKVVNAFAERTSQSKCKTLQPAVNKLETLPLASQGCTNALSLKAGRAIQTPGKRYLTSSLGYGQAASDMAASMSCSPFSNSIFLDDPNGA